MQEVPEIFFDDIYAYFWPIESDERAIKEADFIEKVLKLNKGEKVLDLCCGPGRHSNILAQRGYKLTGIEISRKLLEIAHQEAVKMEVAPNYIEKDIREMGFTNEFDACFCFFTSFGFFPDKENELILENVHKSLKSSGRFLLETINRDYIIKNFRPTNVTEKEGNYILHMNDFDLLQGMINTRWIVILKDSRKEFKTSVRLYTANEFISVLQRTGFQDINVLGHMGAPYSIDSPRMAITAVKP